eukprot:2978363-Rhodomonas_salina.4
MLTGPNWHHVWLTESRSWGGRFPVRTRVAGTGWYPGRKIHLQYPGVPVTNHRPTVPSHESRYNVVAPGFLLRLLLLLRLVKQIVREGHRTSDPARRVNHSAVFIGLPTNPTIPSRNSPRVISEIAVAGSESKDGFRLGCPDPGLSRIQNLVTIFQRNWENLSVVVNISGAPQVPGYPGTRRNSYAYPGTR